MIVSSRRAGVGSVPATPSRSCRSLVPVVEYRTAGMTMRSALTHAFRALRSAFGCLCCLRDERGADVGGHHHQRVGHAEHEEVLRARSVSSGPCPGCSLTDASNGRAGIPRSSSAPGARRAEGHGRRVHPGPALSMSTRSR
jgi:hypothetical protein